MKKQLLAIACLLISIGSLASSLPAEKKETPALNANQVLIPVGKTGKTISLFELSRLSASGLEELTGRKLNFFQKIQFKLAKQKLKKAIAEDGRVVNRKMARYLAPKVGNVSGFHGVGFILGFFLGVLGVVLAYVINEDEDKRNRVRWAWIGFGLATVLTIALYVALIAALA